MPGMILSSAPHISHDRAQHILSAKVREKLKENKQEEKNSLEDISFSS